jgi:predicted TIM-barrel fold metal-dependent hydrolase
VAPVIDSHAHIFPYLGDASGFDSEAEHLWFMQLYMATHGEPVRRVRDHVQIHQQTLHSGRLDAADCLCEVNFRVGRNGRFEWTAAGEVEDVYLQYFPPSLQNMESPASFMLQQMARAGVDRAVLQNARPYGRLNEYFAAAIREAPDRFIGLADVDEPNAATAREITRLRHAVTDLGMRGLYYANRALLRTGYAQMFDDPGFDPFWDAVRDLGIPVFFEIFGVPDPNDRQNLLTEIDRLNRWTERWPSIRCVWTHGFDPQLVASMPPPVAELLGREQVMVELLYPIYWARTHEYPFAELQSTVQTLYQSVGRERLIWGSDMPNVERNCTYRQSLHYLRRLAEAWLPEADLERILGLNVLGLLTG